MWSSRKRQKLTSEGFLDPTGHSPLQGKKKRRPLPSCHCQRGKGFCRPIMATFMSFVKPASDSPYGRAKHVQLIDKDPNKAVSLFRAAINAGDRVDRALKDRAVVRQIHCMFMVRWEADKDCKVSREEDSDYFEQEKTRILGNLAWAYLQQRNYGIAEQHYRKAVSGARKE